MEEAPNDVESCKMHSEDDKASLEKNRKRTVKTQAQVQELEKFYNEHKYPTESMKMQVAEAIGLTEKQVSGWFCHRRLKDKRLLSGDNNVISKQDRSSGVIQDRGSGQRQDSCGSTKQGDGRNFDGREVESGILTIQDSSAVELRYENGGHFSGNKNHMDDTSSGSSSSLRDMSNHHQGDPFDVATSRYLVPKLPMDVKARRGPSGYLKVKGQVENSAITAVKRQLGKHYREDGPPLGVEFDPLPPGAFEDSMENPVDETYYTEEATLPVSPDFSNIHQRFKFGKGNEYSSSRALLNSDIDRTSFRTPQVYAGDRSGSESRDDYKMKYTQDFQVKRTNSVPAISHAQLPGANLRRERKPSFRKYNDVCRNSSKGEYELSDLPIKGSEYPDSFNPAQISKDGKAYVERITNENWAMIPYKTDRFATKKMRGEFWKKASLLDNETGTYRSIRGVAAEMPSSFTEDDGSAQTSCSVE